ncbi:MAG: sigma-70 family RNA polymerase sigma factor [Planctomycetes bacterium]|nr:sigma-70 family RNA polymerase sigma factor [Planctomycetota bacterium]
MTLAHDRYSHAKVGSERDELILRFVPLVHHVLDRLGVSLPTHLDREDLISAGTCGLIQAANNYDPTKGASFKSHAYSRIMGSILDSLRRADTLPRQRRQQLRRLNQAYRDLTTPEGPPTLEQLAEELGSSEEDLDRLLDLAQRARLVSLEAPVGSEGSQLSDALAAPSESPPWLKASAAEDRDSIQAALALLPPRELEVLGLYYFKNLLLREIGALLEVSESRVSQLRSRAIYHLHEALLKQRAGAEEVA